jgi:primosomal protein N' (replication factor Y)
MIRIVCAADGADGTAEIAGRLHRLIARSGVAVLGPAPLFRLRGRARSQLVVKATDRPAAIAAVGGAVDAVAAVASRRKVSVSVDVDPQ